MMMQLVMIRATNTESWRDTSKAYALSTWSTSTTSDATTVICTMMRTLLGISLRINEMIRLDDTSTKTTAMPITSDGLT